MWGRKRVPGDPCGKIYPLKHVIFRMSVHVVFLAKCQRPMLVCGTGYRPMVLELCRTKHVFVSSLDIAPLWFYLLLKAPCTSYSGYLSQKTSCSTHSPDSF